VEHLRVYAFDADPEECARLQADAPANVTYVPYALGDRAGTARLHLTADPACSSLFPPDGEALATFPELHVAAQIDTREIRLHTLDGWASEAGVAAVDVLKLDVQGGELAVLRGAERVLSTVRLIEAEVTFNPIYEGQPLFGELDVFLRDRGFLLWRLGHLVHYATERQHKVAVQRTDRQFFDSDPVDFPVGSGQLMWGHAYYCARELVRGGWTDAARAQSDAYAAKLFDFEELAEPALADALSLRRRWHDRDGSG
jgi:FkbM family methyltransferase